MKNQLMNSDRNDQYQTIEFTVTKRMSGRWSAIASFWAVKYDAWLPDQPIPRSKAPSFLMTPMPHRTGATRHGSGPETSAGVI